MSRFGRFNNSDGSTASTQLTHRFRSDRVAASCLSVYDGDVFIEAAINPYSLSLSQKTLEKAKRFPRALRRRDCGLLAEQEDCRALRRFETCFLANMFLKIAGRLRKL